MAQAGPERLDNEDAPCGDPHRFLRKNKRLEWFWSFWVWGLVFGWSIIFVGLTKRAFCIRMIFSWASGRQIQVEDLKTISNPSVVSVFEVVLLNMLFTVFQVQAKCIAVSAHGTGFEEAG